MPLLEEHSQPDVEMDVSALESSPVQRQRRQMLIALALLLAALMLVLIKDRNFWFPPVAPPVASSQTVEPAEENGDDVAPSAKTEVATAKPNPAGHAKVKPHAAAIAAATKTTSPSSVPVIP